MFDFFPQQVFFFDKLSLFFLAVICLACTPALVFSAGYMREESQARKSYSWFLTLAFILSMCLVTVSGNLIFFLVSWELMSLASYLLIVSDFKHEKSLKAGTIYLTMTHAGTACITAGFLLLYRHTGSLEYSAIRGVALSLPAAERFVIFLLLLSGFTVKAGAVPVHVWLPYAHPQAPAHISSMMSGVMIKIALYGMMRFFLDILGPGPAWWGGLVMALGVLSCLVGAIYALTERDLKRLLAYCSVENIGVILLGLGAALFFRARGIYGAALLGLCAALYHTVNHAVFKSLLFLCSGSIYRATGLRDIEKMGGLIKRMPFTTYFFLVGAMGAASLPPFNGFVSEWLTFQSFFYGITQLDGPEKVFMVLSAAALALAGGLAAASFIRAFGVAFLALPRSRRAQEASETSPSMRAGMFMLALPVFLLGAGAFYVAPLLAGVSRSLPGFEGADISLYAVSLVPALIALILFFFAAAAYLFSRRAARSVSSTWGCGYYYLDSRNEYTATAFSKPFRIAFGFFLKPYRRSEKIRDSFYHVRSFAYETHTTPVFKEYFYKPLLRLVYAAAFKMRKLQPGSIHLYILYIFTVLVALIAATTIF